MGIFDFLHSKSNPANAATPYLNQIPGATAPYYQPYAQQGQEAGNQAMGQYSQMGQNPVDYYNKIMEGYNPSKGYELKRDEIMRAMQNSAAAGGYAGLPQDQLRQAEVAQGLLSNDSRGWLDQVLGLQKTGLSGLSHTADTGQEAGMQYGNILGNTLGSQAGLAYKGQENKNQMFMDILKSLIQGGSASGGIW